MSESYRVLEEFRFATGETLHIGDLFRDNGNSPIQDAYRVKAIRRYRRSGLEVVLTIIRREHNGQVTEPGVETQWPVAALFDNGDRIVRVTTEQARPTE